MRCKREGTDLHHLLHAEAVWTCTRAEGNCFTALLVDSGVSAAGPTRDFWMQSLKDKDLKAWACQLLKILLLFVQMRLHLLQLAGEIFSINYTLPL